MKLSFAEENYLKTIYRIGKNKQVVQTNAIAILIKTKASSVTDMLDKLSLKKLISYTKYKGVSLTRTGKKHAILIIRKHRLWEYFLVYKLGFSWDKVHDIAEQLEHIASDELIERLDVFLGEPKFDPHGDPIPNNKGQYLSLPAMQLLGNCETNKTYKIGKVDSEDDTFLSFLNTIGLQLASEIRITHKFAYNSSMEIEIIKNKKKIILDTNIHSKIHALVKHGSN